MTIEAGKEIDKCCVLNWLNNTTNQNKNSGYFRKNRFTIIREGKKMLMLLLGMILGAGLAAAAAGATIMYKEERKETRDRGKGT